MEGIRGTEWEAFATLAAIWCVLPLAFGLLTMLPMLLWRRYIFNRRRRGTFEGDLAAIVSEARERLEPSEPKNGGAKTPKWLEKALRERQGGPQGGELGG